MGFLDQLFGTELPLAVRFLLAFAVVLGLIGLSAWGIRRFSGYRRLEGAANRNRQPRLGILDVFSIDGRRKLILIRRDNVEHLLMIGGPNDVVVENEIVRIPAQRDQRSTQMTLPLAPAPEQAPPQHPGAPRTAAQSVPPASYAQAPQRPAAPPPVSPPLTAGFGGSGRPDLRPRPPITPPTPASSAPPAANAANSAAPQTIPPARPVAPSVPPASLVTSSTPLGRSLATPLPVQPASENATPAQTPASASPVMPPPAPAAAKVRTDMDPLFADIEKKLEEALKSRPQPTRPAQAPAAPPIAPTPPSPAPAIETNTEATPPRSGESTVSSFASKALASVQQRSAAPAPVPPQPEPVAQQTPAEPVPPPSAEPKEDIAAPEAVSVPTEPVASEPAPASVPAPEKKPNNAVSALDSLEEEMASLLGRGDK